MKLEHGEDPADMRDKIRITVSNLKRTPKGFRETSAIEMFWRTGEDGAKQYYSITKLVSTIPATYKGKLALMDQRIRVHVEILKNLNEAYALAAKLKEQAKSGSDLRHSRQLDCDKLCRKIMGEEQYILHLLLEEKE